MSMLKPTQEKRVLLVDDELEILDLLCDEIKEMGYEAHTADNAQIALTKVQNNSYDLLITDFSMPGVSGIELIREMRKLGFNFPVILMLTATKLNPQLLKDLNVSCTLSKPFDYNTLQEKVKELLVKK